ncbi:DUF2711 family protein [Maribacter sp. 2307ULW6-5]|uniref:DUF2711 family protein n=1 Tax=Maribacter sp. 2307ULW6-5 TaxID=3386275 RepID=UPI0039BD5ED9
MNIFKAQKLYPEEDTPLLEHYAAFDAVFIGLLPFFTCGGKSAGAKSSKQQLSPKEAREKDPLLKNIGLGPNVEVYQTNEAYPNDDEIARNGSPVAWKEIIGKTDLTDHRELNKALMTSIGAYKKPLQRHDLTNELMDYSTKNNIWHPTEGGYDVFTKRAMYRFFKQLGMDQITVQDEFYEERIEVNVNSLSEQQFIKSVGFSDYYLYPNNKAVLFSIGWDYFFFFIAIKEGIVPKNKITEHFEGFWATATDTHNWTWEAGEIERILNGK